jgi:hypothetical protein
MMRTAILAALLVAAGATAVTAALAPSGFSVGHYGQTGKPAYVKGAILKNCLENQGECALVVY